MQSHVYLEHKTSLLSTHLGCYKTQNSSPVRNKGILCISQIKRTSGEHPTPSTVEMFALNNV